MKAQLQQLLGQEALIVPAKVTKVDENAKTCDCEPLNGDAEFVGVPLQACIESDSGFCLYPKEGSIITLAIIDGTSPDGAIIISTSQITKMECTIGEIAMQISSDVVFNDGQNGGVVKWTELKVQIEQLKSFCEGLRTVFNSWVPVPSDGGAALKAILTSSLPTLQTGNFENLSDSKFKH